MTVDRLTYSLQKNMQTLKKALPSEDVLSFVFESQDGVNCAFLYADGMVDKQVLGDLVARPLSSVLLKEHISSPENAATYVQKTTFLAECKQMDGIEDIQNQITI